MKCPCCGGEMTASQVLDRTVIYKCSQCGLSNSILKDQSLSDANQAT